MDDNKVIIVHKEPCADSRSSGKDFSLEKLINDTDAHCNDVEQAMALLARMLIVRGEAHDYTKVDHMEDFFNALSSGHVKDSDWYKMHITKERHHLKSHIPDDVNMIDIIECIVDCTMASITRGNGEPYDLDLDPNIFQLAINNTVKLIKDHTKLVDDGKDILDEEVGE